MIIACKRRGMHKTPAQQNTTAAAVPMGTTHQEKQLEVKRQQEVANELKLYEDSLVRWHCLNCWSNVLTIDKVCRCGYNLNGPYSLVRRARRPITLVYTENKETL